MKVFVIVIVSLVVGFSVGWSLHKQPANLDIERALNSGGMTVDKVSPTKIPYNNGFYAGPYNPKLPVIDPSK